MHRIFVWVGIVCSAVLLVLAWFARTPFSFLEAIGFVTGAACVYLAIRENIWNFPIGIANNIFFLILFGQARLFGDAGLQIVYVGLGLHGWYQWLHGGKNRAPRKIANANVPTIFVALLSVIVGTVLLIWLLEKAKGSAPVPDSFTTVLSLVAQVLLNRKIIANWFFWMVADVVYVWLYITRGLYLTAILYAIFLGMCVAGYLHWRDRQQEEMASND